MEPLYYHSVSDSLLVTFSLQLGSMALKQEKKGSCREPRNTDPKKEQNLKVALRWATSSSLILPLC